MDNTGLYRNTMIGLGTVLLLVKEMHKELIGQIEALPLGSGQEELLRGLREHADRITEETIVNRLKMLYPDLKSLQMIVPENEPVMKEGTAYVR